MLDKVDRLVVVSEHRMKKQIPNRIYIFVPRYFVIGCKKIQMSAGRAAAQCAHLGARLSGVYDGVSSMTTIILAAESPNHLEQIQKALDSFHIDYFPQYDNYDGGNETVLQTIATEPLTEKQSQIFAFSRLW